MRKATTFALIIILFTSFTSVSNTGLPAKEKSSPGTAKIEKDRERLKKFASMKIRDYEKLTGKKMRLKDKIVFKLAQLKIKKEIRNEEQDKPSKKGNTAFILALIGLCLFVIGIIGAYVLFGYALIPAVVLAIIGVVMGNHAKKENPNDKKAKTAVLLGWITLGLTAFLLLLALIVAATWDWY